MSVGVLVASSEPGLIKALGRSSSVPERHGVDILIPSLRLGVQRKQVNDLVASLVGDRLAKELMQMQQLKYRVLMVEGKFAWNADGEWINGFQRFTQDQYRGVLYSVQQMGVMVVETRDMRDTVNEVGHLIRWASKKDHTSLLSRPKYLMSKWGTRDSADFGAWIVQGFEGMGTKNARALVKHFGGVPLRWTVTEEELRKVPGIGRERARRLMRALGQNGNG